MRAAALALIVLSLACAACSSNSNVPAGDVTAAIDFNGVSGTGFQASVSAFVAGTTPVVATFPGANPGAAAVDLTFNPGQNAQLVELLRTEGWLSAVTLPIKLRFAGQPPEAGVPLDLHLTVQQPAVPAGTAYLVPLKTRAAVGEDVPLMLLQGAPEGPVTALTLTLDCGGAAEYVAGSIRLGGPAHWTQGAWTTPPAAINLPPAASPAGSVDSTHAADGLLTVRIDPAFAGSGPGAPPVLTAAKGEVCMVTVRYTAPGTYALALPDADGDHYEVQATRGGAAVEHDWESYQLDMPGVSTAVTVE